MTDETIIAAKKVDGFTHESPIRAFTDFKVNGKYAIGKGFRPSLAHLGAYLDAMHTKEGWALAQIILPRDSDGEPTIVFWKSTYNPVMPELRVEAPVEHDPNLYPCGCVFDDGPVRSIDADSLCDYVADFCAVDRFSVLLEYRSVKDHQPGTDILRSPAERLTICPVMHNVEHSMIRAAVAGWHDRNPDKTGYDAERTIGMRPELGMGYAQGELRDVVPGSAVADIYEEFARRTTDVPDPLNPVYYHGRECADIGELLTANSYQILKYNWRLGEKDSPCKEIGKALWYLDSEIKLHGDTTKPQCHALPDYPWFDAKLLNATDHARAIARVLISWNRYGNMHSLRGLRKLLQTKLDEMNGCTEWGRGLQP